jgi:hypothetical protein
MGFTAEEQTRLGELYAPILFVHRDDVAPINPAEYVRRAALWTNNSQDLPNEEFLPNNEDWGAPTGAPDLLPGSIAASPQDPDIAERTLLWTHINAGSAPAFFLDHGGWDNHDPTPLEQSLPLPAAGEVNETTENLMGSVGAAHARWNHQEPHPELNAHIGCYSVQAFNTTGDPEELREKLVQRGDPAAEEVFPTLAALFTVSHPCWIIFYHFFFPYRSERIYRCEFVATLKNLGLKVPFDLQTEYFGFLDPIVEGSGTPLHVHRPPPNNSTTFLVTEAGLPYSLGSAAHLGQFMTIGLVVPVPTSLVTPPGSVQLGSLLDLPSEAFASPIFVGFGQSAAAQEFGTDLTDPENPRHFRRGLTVANMEFFSAGDFDLQGRHPHVFVSPFTHNTRPIPGDFPMPTAEMFPSLCPIQKGGRGPDEDLPFDKKKRRRRKFLVSLLKFLTMGAVGGLFSTVAESAPTSRRPTLPNVGSPFGEPIDGLKEEDIGLILAPTELVGTFADNTLVRTWGQRLFDENWWEATNLSWGPPTLMDPNRRRQGQAMPNFIGPFVRSLGAHLEELKGN